MVEPPAPLSRPHCFVTAGFVAPWLENVEAGAAGAEGGFVGLAIVAVVATLALAASLPAQQLLPLADAEFDSSVGSWDTNDPNSEITFGSNDVTECGLDSGSGRAENAEIPADILGQFFPNCVTVVGGETYSFGGYIRFITGQTATGTGQFELLWNDALNCTGLVAGATFSSPIVPSSLAGSWVPSVGVTTSPVDALSVEIRFRLNKITAGDSLAARIDSVYVAHANYIFGDRFEIGNTCRWSVDSP